MLTMVKVTRKSCNNVDDNIEEELKLETWHQNLELQSKFSQKDRNIYEIFQKRIDTNRNIRVVGTSGHNATLIDQAKGNQMKPSKCGNYALVIRGDYPVERTVLGCAMVQWLD